MTAALGLPAWAPVALAAGGWLAWRVGRRLLALALAVAFAAALGVIPLMPGGRTGGPLAPGAPVPAVYRGPVNRAGAICPDITPSLIAAQLSQESGFNPTAESHDSRGRPLAMGIAQFIPATWRTWGGGGDVWDPADAIAAQGRLMCHLAAAARAGLSAGRMSGSVTALALAGYNAGFAAVQSARGVPAIPETVHYVAAITRLAGVYTDPSRL